MSSAVLITHAKYVVQASSFRHYPKNIDVMTFVISQTLMIVKCWSINMCVAYFMEFGGDTKRIAGACGDYLDPPNQLVHEIIWPIFFEFKVGSGVDSLFLKPLQVIHDECQS